MRARVKGESIREKEKERKRGGRKRGRKRETVIQRKREGER